jgi:hypothetical protein
MKYNAPFGSTDPNASYVDRDTPAAVKGSAVPAMAIEAAQRELVALIIAAGLTPSNSDLTQVPHAIQTGKLTYAVAGGTANAITATLNPVPAALAAGLRVSVKIASANTGAATLNLNGLGAVAITRIGAAPLKANDLVPGIADLEYDGTQWQLMSISPGSTPSRNIQAFASGTTIWTCPAGVYWVKSRVWGAGGSGGSGNGSNAAGGGGGSGGYSEGWFAVVPGTNYTVVVGAGGAVVSTAAATGNTGGSSSFGSFNSATGGNGGIGSNAAGGNGGTGGSATGGQYNVSGNSGGNAYQVGTPYVGGAGGASYAGTGGFSGAVFGAPAQSAGAGGSGASGGSAGLGAAANGLVLIEY